MSNYSNKISLTNKKFCVLTTGRAGSTSLMNVLEEFDDIAVPNKNFECQGSELLHPIDAKRHMAEMSKLTEKPIRTYLELIESFYHFNRDSAYVGFKLMPNAFKKCRSFLQSEDITFIVLVRDDIPSLMSSLYMSLKYKTWIRTGEKQKRTSKIRGIDKVRIRMFVRLYCRTIKIIDAIKPSIRIRYEDLVQPDFNNIELDGFFNRHIQLNRPLKPTSGADYIENWEWLKETVERGVSNC